MARSRYARADATATGGSTPNAQRPSRATARSPGSWPALSASSSASPRPPGPAETLLALWSSTWFRRPPRALSSSLMLADLERARHPASSPSRLSRPAGCCCGGSGSRRGLHPRRQALRQGSECRKSLQAPGSSCVRGRGRGRQNILEEINNSTEKVQYLHHDQQGSTRLVTGEGGKTEATFTYGAYGELTGSTGTATTPLRYDGQLTSSETGLIYMRARTYDPATAQFLSVDPLGPVTRAPYTYAEDDPVNLLDRSGLASEGEVSVPCVWPFCSPPPSVTEGAEQIGKGVVEGGREAGEGVVHGAEGVIEWISGDESGKGSGSQGEESAEERGGQLRREGEELLGRKHSPAARERWQEWYEKLSKGERGLYRKCGGPTPRSRN